MDTDRGYTYAVLRYVHDTTREEFVNIGVVAIALGDKICAWKYQDYFARILAMWPEIKVEDLEANIGGQKISHMIRNQVMQQFEADFLLKKEIIFKRDDGSSWRYSDPGSGVLRDGETLQAVVDRIYARMVS